MADKGKRSHDSSDSDSDSGPDDRNERPTKASKTGSDAKRLKNSDGEVYFELERQRRVTVREFKNKIYVDIREFYEKDGKMLPGKKGISLNATAWIKLKNMIDDIDEEIQKLA